MRRREFITLLGGAGAAAAWPLVARAQQPRMPVIGFLHSATPDGYAPMLAALHSGLKDTGYIDGRNVAIEYRWAHDQNDRLPALADELVRRQVRAIVANGPAVFAAKAATATIPVVFFTGGDPVNLGLVASLSQPGGNLTGVTMLNVELGPKRLELVREMIPAAASVGLLVNPTNPNAASVAGELEPAARVLGLQLHVLKASDARDIDAAFAALRERRVQALVIGPDPFFNTRYDQLGSLTIRHAMPTIYQYREFAAAGGLMSYGGTINDLYRRAGVYAGRVLNGEKPVDLPIQQSTKAELFVNLKTAKALGINVPLSLLARADEVIE